MKTHYQEQNKDVNNAQPNRNNNRPSLNQEKSHKKNTLSNTIGPYIILMSTVVLIYFPVVNHDFLYLWDDHWVVINHYTTGGFNWSNLYHIFTDFSMGNMLR